ncbi:hypothetical protein JCM10212_002610 [Sporobolomyces blumeae]
MSFSPRLGSTTVVPVDVRVGPEPSTTPAAEPRHLTFTYFLSEHDADDRERVVEEVWTNCPDGTWHAVPFVNPPTCDSLRSNSSRFRIARISLDSTTGGHVEFEYTYRLRHRNEEGVDGEGDSFEWLGSTGSNGKIILVPHDSSTSSRDWESSGGEGEWESSSGEAGVKIGKFRLEAGQDNVEVDLTNEVVAAWNVDGAEMEGLVLEQSSRTWFVPRTLPRPHPLAHLSISFTAQLVLLRALPSPSTPTSKLLVIFPFSKTETTTALVGREGYERRQIVARIEREGLGRDEEGHGWVVVASGVEGQDSFDSLIARAVDTAYSNSASRLSNGTSTRGDGLNPIQDVSLCTWNALGPTYTVSSLLSWLDSIVSPENVTPELIDTIKKGRVLLDDGWQDTAEFEAGDGRKLRGNELRGLKSFGVRDGWYDLDGGSTEVQARGLGWELKDAVSKIKERGFAKVGVWITITGYWESLHPSFDAVPTTIAEFSSPQHDSFAFTSLVPTLDSLSLFFSKYFDVLKRAGISFIKIDNQALVDSIAHLADGTSPGAYRAQLLESMQTESEKAFGRENVIHCMAHSNRIWSGPLALSSSSTSYRSIPTLRNSDDFFPDAVDSHRWHLYINAINLLLTRRLSFRPDLDMAMERHEYGAFHLAARAFSTAEAWSTDTFGEWESAGTIGGRDESRGKLGEPRNGWKGVVATTKRDGHRVLQARSKPGAILSNQVLARDLVASDGGEGQVLKVGLECDRAGGATIGMWNCQADGDARAVLSTRDLLDARPELSRSTKDAVVFVDRAFGADPVDSAKAASGSTTTVTTVASSILRDAASRAPTPTALSPPVTVTTLPARSTQLARIADLEKITGTKGETFKIACLGLRDKFVGLEAIRKVKVGPPRRRSSGRLISTTVKPVAPPVKNDVGPRAGSSAAPATASRSFPTPPPNTHLPFLLTYFSNFFVRTSTASHTASSSISTTAEPARSPSSIFSGFFVSLLRRPISTIVAEIKGFFTFGLAVVVWALKSREPMVDEDDDIEDRQRDDPGSPGATTLEVELDFLSSELLFYVSPLDTGCRNLTIRLDGVDVDAKFIRAIEENGPATGLVEVDAEGAWRALSEQESDEASWIVEVGIRA